MYRAARMSLDRCFPFCGGESGALFYQLETQIRFDATKPPGLWKNSCSRWCWAYIGPFCRRISYDACNLFRVSWRVQV